MSSATTQHRPSRNESALREVAAVAINDRLTKALAAGRRVRHPDRMRR